MKRLKNSLTATTTIFSHIIDYAKYMSWYLFKRYLNTNLMHLRVHTIFSDICLFSQLIICLIGSLVKGLLKPYRFENFQLKCKTNIKNQFCRMRALSAERERTRDWKKMKARQLQIKVKEKYTIMCSVILMAISLFQVAFHSSVLQVENKQQTTIRLNNEWLEFVLYIHLCVIGIACVYRWCGYTFIHIYN